DWLARFTTLFDEAVIRRLLVLLELDDASSCWCVCGASGRGEALTRVIPDVVLITDGRGQADGREPLMEELRKCDYLPAGQSDFDAAYSSASVDEWQRRFSGWIAEPVLQQMYRARAFLDLRPIHGDVKLWDRLNAAVSGAIDHSFKYVLANDCMSTLPPL